MSILCEIMKDNPHEMLNTIKTKLYNESIEVLEHNTSYENLFREIKKTYHREKCDACYLFTFASANITKKTHINFFSKLLFSYAQLYLEKGDSIRSIGVISQYIINASQYIKCNMERNDIVTHVFDDFYSFMKSFPKNMNSVLCNISLESLSNSKPNVNFFFLMIQCLSLIESNDTIAIEQFTTFYIENEYEIKKTILNKQKRLETFIKLLSRMAESILSKITSGQNCSKEIGQLLYLAMRILSIVLSSLIQNLNNKSKDEEDNQLTKMIFNIVIVNLTKISILLSKGLLKQNLHCYYLDSLNDFIDKAISHIENYLEKDINEKTLKIYSSILGKAENIFANIDDISNRNKYSIKIVEMYKKYKYSSVDLLRVKVNLFKSFVSEYYGTENQSVKFNYDSFQSHIEELIILINSTSLSDDNEKEYFNGMMTFLIKLIENSIFNEIHKGSQSDRLVKTIDYLYSSFALILSNKQSLLLKDFGLFFDLLYVLSIESFNEDKRNQTKSVNLLKLFNSLGDNNDAKKINCYSQMISYFLCLSNRFDVIREKINNLSQSQSDIKYLIMFYSHILYFISKTAPSCIRDQSSMISFLFDTMNIVMEVIDSRCNIISYKEIKELFEKELLTSFQSLIRNDLNQIMKQMDIYNDINLNSNNEVKDDKDFIQFLNNLFKHIQRLIRLNEKITSMLHDLKSTDEAINFNTEVNCNSHIDMLINIALKLYSYTKPYNLLLLQNTQILDNSFSNRNSLLFIKLLLTSLIKNSSMLKKKSSIDYQYRFNKELNEIFLNQIQLRNSNDANNENHQSKKGKSKSDNDIKQKKYFVFKNIHTYLNINFSNIFLDECISYQLSNHTKSKTDFIINQLVLKSIIEKDLLLNGNSNLIENKQIVNTFLSNNIEYITQIIHSEDKNNKDRIHSYKTLHYSLLIYKAIVTNQIDLVDNSTIINLINDIPVFDKTNTLKTNIDQISIIKLLSLFYQNFHMILSKDINDIITLFLKRVKDNLTSERSNRNFSLFEYVSYLDINYALYTSSLQTNTLTMKDMINEGKELLEDLVSMYKIELTQKAKNIIDSAELLKSKVALAFICNYRFVENSFLALLGIVDYQFIVIDTVAKIAQLVQSLFLKLNQCGYCNVIIKMYSLIDKISLLVYNKHFITFALELLIKITRNLKRNSICNLIPDELGFDSFNSFVEIISDIIYRYLNLKYNVEYDHNNKKHYNKIEILETDIREIAIKYDIRDIAIDKSFHSNVTIKTMDHCNNDIKRITSMLKHNLVTNDKEDYLFNSSKALFNQVYFNNNITNEEDITSFYLENITNIQYKHQIKLIPYFYPHIISMHILNEKTFRSIISKFTNELYYNCKQQNCIDKYKQIKHMKKVITELIFFATKNKDEISSCSIEKLLLFYIKHLLNFKYRLYSNQYLKTNNDSDSDDIIINFISLFRIKQSLFFCIKYKERIYYNVIELNTKQVINIFSSLQTNLRKTHTTNKIIKSTLISKLEINLDTCFLQLQSLFVSSNIIEALIQIYLDNNSLNNYLNTKLIKYPVINQPIEEIIKELFNQEQSFLKSTSDKRSLSSSEYLPKLKKKLHGIKKTKMSLYDRSQGIFYYIPSGDLSSLPIENLPYLFKLPISRLINYTIIQFNTNYDKQHNNLSISPNEILCLLNPSKDLIDSEKFLSPIIQTANIDNIIGKPVANDEMRSKIQTKKMFIYCGHGDGTKYLNASYIKNNKINFISLLFGCSSVRVNDYLDKDTQPFGLPHFYQINHCPFLLGFLWSVTSRDIDRFLLNILTALFDKKTISLIEVISLFKSKISNKNLNAASLVIYSDKDICLTINN